MKLRNVLAGTIIGALSLTSVVHAAPSRTYQVTGPILEMTDTMVTVQKGKERWELTRDATTRANGELKVGDKVTITYTMTATKIDAKGSNQASKEGPKAASTPASSPAKK